MILLDNTIHLVRAVFLMKGGRRYSKEAAVSGTSVFSSESRELISFNQIERAIFVLYCAVSRTQLSIQGASPATGGDGS